MNDKNTNIRELNAENMEQVTGGDKIMRCRACCQRYVLEKWGI